MSQRIGIIGLGRMGSALARRAASQGFDVAGWSRSGGDASDAVGAGYALQSFEDVVQHSDILMLSLFDDDAVDNVLGRLANLPLNNRLIVETSTVSPSVCRKHEGDIQTAGGRLIDAPISGGPEMVIDGTMGLFIGGEDADVARFMQIAPSLSNRISHIGPLGAGAAAKIVNNVALAGAFTAAIEAILLGARMGLSLPEMLGFLEKSPGTTPMFKSRVPGMLGQDDTVGFSIDGAVKDGTLFVAEARRMGADVPAMQRMTTLFQDAAAAGLGTEDVATVVKYALDQDVMSSKGS